ncbi:MAG TPA: hypothetical protein VGB73_10980 [Pyrinomonadaceae bacterium]
MGGRRGGAKIARRAARRRAGARRLVSVLLVLASVLGASGCARLKESVGLSVAPRTLRDVPAARLAFRFEPDLAESNLPTSFTTDETEEPLAAIKSAFETNRSSDALLRTIPSPDGQIVLALYATPDTAEGDYRIDMYAPEGKFLRNVLPPELTGTFPQWVEWSSDGQRLAFIGIRNATPLPTPTPLEDVLPPVVNPEPPVEGAATPTPSVAPIIAPVPTYSTEQIYICDRYGYGLKPLTTRDGLIYFQFEWAPDNHALVALACKPEEWDARRAEDKTPAGRPRIIDLEGRERLLSDQLGEAAPTWSPDSSKVAAAFETDVVIYDAAGDAPTGANIPLREPLLAASARYDAEKLPKASPAPAANANAKQTATATPAPSGDGNVQPPTSDAPLSFNPVIRLEWLQPETLFVHTAFQRLYKGGEFIRNYPRWHVLHLSPQAAVLSRRTQPSTNITTNATAATHPTAATNATAAATRAPTQDAPLAFFSYFNTASPTNLF